MRLKTMHPSHRPRLLANGFQLTVHLAQHTGGAKHHKQGVVAKRALNIEQQRSRE